MDEIVSLTRMNMQVSFVHDDGGYSGGCSGPCSPIYLACGRRVRLPNLAFPLHLPSFTFACLEYHFFIPTFNLS